MKTQNVLILIAVSALMLVAASSAASAQDACGGVAIYDNQTNTWTFSDPAAYGGLLELNYKPVIIQPLLASAPAYVPPADNSTPDNGDDSNVPGDTTKPMYYGNKDTHVLHMPGCQHITDNTEELYSLEEAKTKGYIVNCGTCHSLKASFTFNGGNNTTQTGQFYLNAGWARIEFSSSVAIPESGKPAFKGELHPAGSEGIQIDNDLLSYDTSKQSATFSEGNGNAIGSSGNYYITVESLGDWSVTITQ